MGAKAMRMGRVFGGDGKAVIVAMDGARSGPAAGLDNPREVVRRVVAGGADAIMTTFGIARTARDLFGRCGLILALDSEGPVSGYGIEAALRLGADAVELKAAPGDAARLADVRELAVRADSWGMPLLVEMLAASWEVALEDGEENVDRVVRAARIGAEAGADFLKVHYVGPPDVYTRVADQVYVPVLVMGGPRCAQPVDALHTAEAALAAGARGVVFGRNVVSCEDPEAMVAALVAVVHGGRSAPDASPVAEARAVVGARR
jgi:class I fructose-bisphosphate aldolase/fructose-bisphosphate aldolase/2-amino-3,7-dideoxy-D-threo-hept-6-ulosonate synthase